jgi:hypothetical protein
MQDGLTPSECLMVWGLEKNETTHELVYTFPRPNDRQKWREEMDDSDPLRQW